MRCATDHQHLPACRARRISPAWLNAWPALALMPHAHHASAAPCVHPWFAVSLRRGMAPTSSAACASAGEPSWRRRQSSLPQQRVNHFPLAGQQPQPQQLSSLLKARGKGTRPRPARGIEPRVSGSHRSALCQPLSMAAALLRRPPTLGSRPGPDAGRSRRRGPAGGGEAEAREARYGFRK